MNKLLKHGIVAALLAANAGISPASAQIVRQRPPLAPTGPVKPVTVPQVRPLTQAELQARMQTPPRYLSASELKARIPGSIAASAVQDLKTAFSLTPAVQSVSGRGSLRIEGDVVVPNPLPAGFFGQATIRYQPIMGTSNWYGGVFLTMNAQKGMFYAIDCLASVANNQNTVNFRITGGDAAQAGRIEIMNGHLIFNVRRSTDDGEINISFQPDKQQPSDPNTDKNIMNFWGCQISTG